MTAYAIIERRINGDMCMEVFTDGKLTKTALKSGSVEREIAEAMHPDDTINRGGKLMTGRELQRLLSPL